MDKEPARRVICFQHRVFAGRLQLAARVFCCGTNDCRQENIKFYQVCLELVEIHVQRAVKPQGGGDGGDDLADQPVKACVTTFSSNVAS